MKFYYATLAIGAIALAGCHHEEVTPQPAVHITAQLALAPGAVVVNPTGYAPLAAQLSFAYPVAGRTRLVVHGKHGADSDVVQQFDDSGTTHSVPILGLYADFDNKVDVQLTDAQGLALADTTLTIHTGALPPAMPTAITVTTAPTVPLGGNFTLVSNFSASNPQVPLIVDNYGDIRWLLDYSSHPVLNQLSYDCGIARLQNGNFYFGDKNTSGLYEVSPLGNIVNQWSLPGYTFHHEMYEKPDGNFLVSVSKVGSTHPDGSPTNEDYIVEIDRHANRVVQEWDLKQSLNETRHALEPDPTDWAHVNALFYDASDNTIVVSARYQAVVKLTYDNHVKWLLAPHRGWGLNHQGQDLSQLLLTPLDASGQAITDTAVVNGSANHPDFEWNWYQHSTVPMPNGDLLLFDNGTNRNFIHNAPSTTAGPCSTTSTLFGALCSKYGRMARSGARIPIQLLYRGYSFCRLPITSCSAPATRYPTAMAWAARLLRSITPPTKYCLRCR
ncbi:aryl-sulfate sulfotransferase [Hymenobacter sp. BRD67]|nr:aryl-sulfate sulfotransferase [Hymenobacter sp. BRD67]QKG52217.1 aryl-sulfate sulfotransferase [Hymenobacter sp. BRD67]